MGRCDDREDDRGQQRPRQRGEERAEHAGAGGELERVTAPLLSRHDLRVDRLDQPLAPEAREPAGALERTEAREVDGAPDGHAPVDQQEQALGHREQLGRLARVGAPEALEAAGRQEHRLRVHRVLVEGAPLVDHAQPVHQQLLGGQQTRRLATMDDGAGGEMEGAARPAQQLEQGVARDELVDLVELLRRELAALGEQGIELCAPFGDAPLELHQPLRSDQPGAHQHVAERGLLVGARTVAVDHRAALEADAQACLAVAHLQHAGLLLLADQLEDFADAEVAQVAVQRHRHAQSFSRSAKAIPSTSR